MCIEDTIQEGGWTDWEVRVESRVASISRGSTWTNDLPLLGDRKRCTGQSDNRDKNKRKVEKKDSQDFIQ